MDTIEQVPPDRWDADAFYDPDPSGVGSDDDEFPMSTRSTPTFSESPVQAVAMDPQHRMPLEVAWEALEHVVFRSDSLSGTRTGVMGLSSGLHDRHTRRADIDAYLSTGTRTVRRGGRTYLLGLRGPAVAGYRLFVVVGAPLGARAFACVKPTRHWRAGVRPPPVTVLTAIALSRGLRCHRPADNSFDANADGFVRGEGCGRGGARAVGRRGATRTALRWSAVSN